MAARRRNRGVASETPYPYEVDDTYKGQKARIIGERGVYTIHAHEFNPRNGRHWFVMFGNDCWRHQHPSKVKPVKRGQRFD